MDLLFESSLMQRTIKHLYKLDTCLAFLSCASIKITDWFYLRTGIRPSAKVCFIVRGDCLLKEDGTPETDESIIRNHYYVKDKISGIQLGLYINKVSYWTVMVWWSKSGRVYEPADVDIDCDDLEFALEPFEPQLYYAQLNYKEPHPFKTDGFSFKLEVAGFDVNAIIELVIRPGKEECIPQLVLDTYAFIDNYNSKSLKKDRKYGVVHNSLIVHKDNNIKIELDSGSAGVRFYQSLLQMFSDTGYVEYGTIS